LEAVARADVVLTSGLGLDDWAREIIDAAGGHAKVVDVGSQVPVQRRTAAGDADPHWWHDPRNAIAAPPIVERGLSRAGDPRAALAPRATDYRTRLRALDAAITRCFAAVPAGERKLVTDHDALGYFASRYGLDVIGAVFPAQSTQAQASA